jgi:hypothetical protein
MRLTNVRRDGDLMRADFAIADGRPGSVSVPAAEYEAHGEYALEQEARACARQHARDGYVEPDRDRFNELD